MVYYRKYRPQTIDQLDSSKLREILTAVLSRPEVPHAFLLTGPKGLGKTSTARIIAKVVNCEHPHLKIENRKSKIEKNNLLSIVNLQSSSSIEPDNTCEQCVSITNGSNLDVLEIDGASNRGIDEIRDLRDKVKLAPSRAKKKVYIIDEVHMLTTEAFNALLKTIEEPPAHVMFIFCTTEPQKVPETIMSRCFHVPYTLATEEDLVRSFKRIVEGEKIAIDEASLHEIARLSDGGFRDGTKILEELVTLSKGKKITKELIEDKYQISNIKYQISNILQSLFKKNTKESLEIIATLQEQGIDNKYFISQILEVLHTLLLEKMGIVQSPSYHLLATSYSLEDIQVLATVFSHAYQETKYAVVPPLPLELAIVAWCLENDTSSRHPELDSGSQKIDSGSESGMTKRSTNNNKHPMDAIIKKEKNLKVQEILKGPKVSKEPEEPRRQISSQEALTDKSIPEQFMENLIYKIKPLNFSVAGVLRGCSVKSMSDGKVILTTGYKFHKEKLHEPKTLLILEKAVKEITGKELQVVVELT